jgi:hypothetical protein
MTRAVHQLADLRSEHDADDVALVVGLKALEAIARPDGPDPIISSSDALALFEQTEELGGSIPKKRRERSYAGSASAPKSTVSSDSSKAIAQVLRRKQ